MTEPGPVSFSLLGAVVAVLGPALGPYALIVFAAFVGCLFALGAEPTKTRTDGLKYMAMGVLAALLFTGPALWLVEKYLDVPAHIALTPVALALGACRNKLLEFMQQTLDAVAAAVGVVINAVATRRGGGQ